MSIDTLHTSPQAHTHIFMYTCEDNHCVIELHVHVHVCMHCTCTDPGFLLWPIEPLLTLCLHSLSWVNVHTTDGMIAGTPLMFTCWSYNNCVYFALITLHVVINCLSWCYLYVCMIYLFYFLNTHSYTLQLKVVFLKCVYFISGCGIYLYQIHILKRLVPWCGHSSLLEHCHGEHNILWNTLVVHVCIVHCVPQVCATIPCLNVWTWGYRNTLIQKYILNMDIQEYIFNFWHG